MKKKFIVSLFLLCVLCLFPLQLQAKEAGNLPAEGFSAPMLQNPYLDPAWLEQKIVVTGPSHSWEIKLSDLGASALYAFHNNGMIGYRLQDTGLVSTWIQSINAEMINIPTTGTEPVFDRSLNTLTTAAPGMICQIRSEFTQMLMQIVQTHLETDAVPGNISVSLLDGYLVAFPAGKSNIIGGSCATTLSGSSSNRINNISVACSHLNDLTIMPGQEISVSTVILPRTAANGYREAGAYLNGETVQALGGGICQVSSTLYNAVMDSGLTVTKRSPHSMPVHYLPLGLDAAISAGSKDLCFRNDYDLPVTLQAGVSGRTLTISVVLNESLLGGTVKNLWSEVPGHNYAKTYLSTYDSAGKELNRVFVGTSRYSDPKPKKDIQEIED